MPNSFDFRLDVLPEHKRWILGIEATDEDGTLAQYVQAGNACYVAHVECKRTYFRDAFLSSKPRFEMQIAGDALFGGVEVSLLLVTVKDLKEYRHPNQHADYRNGAFSVSIGEPLAVAVSKSFDAFLEADPILKLSSIIDIRRAEGLRRMQVISNEGHRIIIKLPSAEFDRYVQLRADIAIRGLIATTVLLPALIDAFYFLRTEVSELDDFKADHRWSRLVLSRLERMDVELVDPDAETGVCLQAAQLLLREPLRRSLEDLSELFK
jgi:hypothetical protein